MDFFISLSKNSHILKLAIYSGVKLFERQWRYNVSGDNMNYSILAIFCFWLCFPP